jgi:hypothetical protein
MTNSTKQYVRSDLLKLLPKTKFDDSNLDSLEGIGFPALNLVLPELLEWIQDINWPVANKISSIISLAGAEIIPEIARIFDSKDEEWIWCMIILLLPNLNPKFQQQILPLIQSYEQTSRSQDGIEAVNGYIESMKTKGLL